MCSNSIIDEKAVILTSTTSRCSVKEKGGTQVRSGERLFDDRVVAAKIGVSTARVNAVAFVIEHVRKSAMAVEVPDV